MADNVPITAGSGTTVAADEVIDGVLGTVKVQFVKIMDGTLDSTTKATIGANGLKVDGSAVTQPVSGTVTVTQGTAANLNATVTGTVAATQSGTWNIGTISGSISLPTGASTAANQPTNAALGSTTSGQTGNLELGAVTSAAPSYTTGQTNALSLTLAGALRVDNSAVTQPVSGTFWQATQPVSIAAAVTVQQATAANLNATVTGTVAATQSGTWNITNISGTVSLPTGAATSANQPTAAAIGSTTSGQTGNLAMGAVTTGAPSYTTATTNNLSLTLAGALRVDGSAVTQPVSLTSTTITGTVATTQSTSPWVVAGDTASGSADANNPIKIGGRIATTNPAVGTAGNRANALFDNLGKLVAVGALRQMKGRQKTSITTGSATTVVTAGGVGVFNDVFAIVVTNKSATPVFVDFSDGSGTVMTIAAPANDTRGFTVAVDSAMPQSTSATAWTATVSTGVTSIEITMLYVSNL